MKMSFSFFCLEFCLRSGFIFLYYIWALMTIHFRLITFFFCIKIQFCKKKNIWKPFSIGNHSFVNLWGMYYIILSFAVSLIFFFQLKRFLIMHLLLVFFCCNSQFFLLILTIFLSSKTNEWMNLLLDKTMTYFSNNRIANIIHFCFVLLLTWEWRN